MSAIPEPQKWGARDRGGPKQLTNLDHLLLRGSQTTGNLQNQTRSREGKGGAYLLRWLLAAPRRGEHVGLQCHVGSDMMVWCRKMLGFGDGELVGGVANKVRLTEQALLVGR